MRIWGALALAGAFLLFPALIGPALAVAVIAETRGER